MDLTSNEKKSLTIIYVLGYYCTKFEKQDRTVETIEFFDEAWFFNSTTVGKQILKRMKRVGRSEKISWSSSHSLFMTSLVRKTVQDLVQSLPSLKIPR